MYKTNNTCLKGHFKKKLFLDFSGVNIGWKLKFNPEFLKQQFPIFLAIGG